MAVIICGPLGMSDSIVTFLVYLAVGAVVTFGFHFVFRAAFVGRDGVAAAPWEVVCKGRYFNDQWGAALAEGVCSIAMAKLLTTFLRSCDCYETMMTQVATNEVNLNVTITTSALSP